MRLKQMTIERVLWGEQAGQLTGTIRFDADNSEVAVRINHDSALRLLEVMSEELVSSAQEVAKMVSQELLEQTALAKDTPPQISHNL